MANWSCCELHSVQSELCQVSNILHLSVHWRSYQLVGDVHHRLNCEGKLSVGFQRMAHLTMSEAFRFVMQSVNCTMFKVHISNQRESRFSRILENYLEISLLDLDLEVFQFHFHFSKRVKQKIISLFISRKE